MQRPLHESSSDQGPHFLAFHQTWSKVLKASTNYVWIHRSKTISQL
jgi:hypothetical protein